MEVVTVATTPSQRTWVTGEVVTAAELNSNVRDSVNFIIAPPLFVGYQTSAQSITTATWTSLLMDTEVIDRDGGHSTVTNTSRYTAQTAGYYRCSGLFSIAGNTTGRRGTRWAVNGTVITSTDVLLPSASATSGFPTYTREVFLNVGDYVELQVFQDSGGSLNTPTAAENQSGVALRWVSTA